ncbi:D-alanyl-D-alanine carboxypeptidase family protein [Microbacterium phyllosphaerae]|uniref:D-alanyl-D-alanine carboxypeptidase family protein n=1 Tax=Microbacterium phyllosphaerae TaxID=124798 RepID=UPI002169F066|nr:D-alanyl-D-alanine carboxypeptidase [Microbacterium phyllosphaerae]MCS3443407.1 D-alanyl-D-alanine carboxypeptidase (penicillin-binding protein 5/6) [Microbacterium phyllosphaerae]
MTAPDSAEATASDAPADASSDGSDTEATTPVDRNEAVDAEATDPAPDTDAADDDATVDAQPTAPVADDADAVDADAVEELDDAPDVQWAEGASGGTPLTWVDPATVAQRTTDGSLDDDADAATGSALLQGARLRPAIARPGLLVPLGVLVGLVAAYAGTTLLWPLHEVPPTVQSVELAPTAAPAATVTWPTQGSAAVGVGGLSTSSSSLDAAAIASVTKVVSSLMVLDQMPLAVGEQGPEFRFTWSDSMEYWEYRRSDQSALDVPVDGTLTEFQLLQGTLLGSANNYIDRLAREVWGSESAFTSAAATWLRDRGLDGITIITPSGFDDRNRATPESLVALAELAMQNPVFAGIVGTPSVDLPGAGTVKNTNGMLADAGVVGVKTGTLGDSWNLLTAKDITIDDTTVHLYAAVLGQADDEQRLAQTRSLFSQVEAVLQAQAPAVAKGTVVGEVTTLWGTTTDVVTDADADVVLWNGATAQTTSTFHLGDNRESGDEIGTVTSTGPLNTITTSVSLADDVEAPSPWWRLTHPFELLGITDEQR